MGGRLNLNGGALNLDGGTRHPYNLSTDITGRSQRLKYYDVIYNFGPITKILSSSSCRGDSF